MYIEIHVHREIVMHTAAAEWEWGIIGEKKKEIKTEWDREKESWAMDENREL